MGVFDQDCEFKMLLISKCSQGFAALFEISGELFKVFHRLLRSRLLEESRSADDKRVLTN